MWIASIIMPCISLWIYFNKGLYADFAINIYYFFMAIFGYYNWTRKNLTNNNLEHSPGENAQDTQKRELPITRVSPSNLFICIAATIILWAALYCILHFFTDSTVPVADAFTTALSIVATWMLARKYIEQWIAWILVDAVCVGLYIYKGIYFYAVLYAIYTAVAVIGYRNWLRIMKTAH